MICSCGDGWTRLSEGEDCFDCTTIDPFCSSCEIDDSFDVVCVECSSDFLMPSSDGS